MFDKLIVKILKKPGSQDFLLRPERTHCNVQLAEPVAAIRDVEFGCGVIWDHGFLDDYFSVIQELVMYHANLNQSIQLADMKDNWVQGMGQITFPGKVKVPCL